MRKSSLFFMFLIFLLALGFVASEEVKDGKMSVDLIFNTSVSNDTLEIHVLLPHDAGGSVLYKIDGKEHRVNVVNGDAPLNVTDLNPGKYELKANYSGDENYSDIENKTMVTIPEVDKLALGDNSSSNDTNDTNPLKNVTNKTNTTNNVTKNATNNVTNKTNTTNNVTKNATNNVTNKTNATNNVTNKTDSKNVTKNATDLLNNITNKTNATSLLNNITNNTANRTNSTVVNNNTTVVVDNQTENNTTISNDKPVDNIPAVTQNSPKKPKINQNNSPFKLDAKTGIPIALVIIAIGIFVGIKRYDL